MLLAFLAVWIGRSATMELSGNHRCGGAVNSFVQIQLAAGTATH